MNAIEMKNLQPIGIEFLPADDATVNFLVVTVEENLCGEMEVMKGNLVEILLSVAKSLEGDVPPDEEDDEDEYGTRGDYTTGVGLMSVIDEHNQNADGKPVAFILNLDTFERII